MKKLTRLEILLMRNKIHTLVPTILIKELIKNYQIGEHKIYNWLKQQERIEADIYNSEMEHPTLTIEEFDQIAKKLTTYKMICDIIENPREYDRVV